MSNFGSLAAFEASKIYYSCGRVVGSGRVGWSGRVVGWSGGRVVGSGRVGSGGWINWE